MSDRTYSDDKVKDSVTGAAKIEYKNVSTGLIDFKKMSAEVLVKLGSFKTANDKDVFLGIMRLVAKHGMINRLGTMYVVQKDKPAEEKFEAYDWLNKAGVMGWFKQGLSIKPDELTPLRLSAILGEIFEKRDTATIWGVGHVGERMYFGGILRCASLQEKLLHMVGLSYSMTQDRTVVKPFAVSFFYRCIINISTPLDWQMLASIVKFCVSSLRTDKVQVDLYLQSVRDAKPLSAPHISDVKAYVKINAAFASLALSASVDSLKVLGDKIDVVHEVIDHDKTFVPQQVKVLYEKRVSKVKKMKKEAVDKTISHSEISTDIKV